MLCQSEWAYLHKTVNMVVFFVQSNENIYTKGRALSCKCTELSLYKKRELCESFSQGLRGNCCKYLRNKKAVTTQFSLILNSNIVLQLSIPPFGLAIFIILKSDSQSIDTFSYVIEKI